MVARSGKFWEAGFWNFKKKTHLSVPGSWFGDCVLRAHRGKVVLEMSFRKLRPTENNVLQRFSTSNVFLVGGSRAGDFRFFFQRRTYVRFVSFREAKAREDGIIPKRLACSAQILTGGLKQKGDVLFFFFEGMENVVVQHFR